MHMQYLSYRIIRRADGEKSQGGVRDVTDPFQAGYYQRDLGRSATF